jgi:hypothetical protein
MKSHYLALTALSTLGLYSGTSHAANISFNFLVNSSGMDIYACDAGILDQGTGGAQSNIQASVGSYNSGNAVSYSPIGVQGNTQFGPPPFHTVAYPGGYLSLTPVLTKLDNVIENLGSGGGLIFNIASDTYGARYFVDICVRGPNLPYQPGTYAYHLDDSVTAADVTAAQYLNNALVDAAGTVVCDARTGGPGEWGSTLIRDNLTFAPGSFLALDGIGTLPIYPGGWGSPAGVGPVNGSAVNVFGALGKDFSMPAPVKYCVVRYIFRETSGAQRIWDPAQAKFNINMNFLNTSYTP